LKLCRNITHNQKDAYKQKVDAELRELEAKTELLRTSNNLMISGMTSRMIMKTSGKSLPVLSAVLFLSIRKQEF